MAQSGEETQSPTLLSSIVASIFPGKRITDGGDPFRRWFNSLVLHFRPRRVPQRTLRFNLTWGLGGTAVVLLGLLFMTGLLLKFAYRSTPEQAYASVQMIQNEMEFGGLIRNVHHWCGHLLVLVAFLHFLRVFFTGAFHPPRQFNWIIGLALFGTVLLANFSGYLLPWDQLAFWAITICTGMLEYLPWIGRHLQHFIRGGAEVGPATLSNFFAIHTAVLPVCLIAVLPFHFWRIRKAGGLVVPRSPQEKAADVKKPLVPAIPDLLLREVVVALVVFAGVMTMAVLVDAPLAEKANPGLSPNPTKAPWYFAGFQELLIHFHPLFALFFIPVSVLAALLAIPYLRYPKDTGGVWFASQTGRRCGLIAAMLALVLTPTAAALAALVQTDQGIGAAASWIFNGLVPAIVILACIVAMVLFLRYRLGAERNEAVQSVFILLVTAFIVLTVIGVWFRGPGMALVWPGFGA